MTRSKRSRPNCSSGEGGNSMARIIGGLDHLARSRRSAARSPRSCSRTLLEAVLRRLSAGRANGSAERQARRRRGLLQRPRPQFLPRQDADLRGRRGARIRNADEGWGIPTMRAVQGRSGTVLAHHRIAGGRGIRPRDLPGDAGRSRLHAADGAVLARRHQCPVRDRADLRQHRAASAAFGRRAASSSARRSAAPSPSWPGDERWW